MMVRACSKQRKETVLASISCRRACIAASRQILKRSAEEQPAVRSARHSKSWSLEANAEEDDEDGSEGDVDEVDSTEETEDDAAEEEDPERSKGMF